MLAGIAPNGGSVLSDGNPGISFIALCFDRAVWTFGTAIESDMDEVENQMSRGKSKLKPERIAHARQQVLDNYLNVGKAREEAQKGRFRDPALSVNRRR